MQLHFTTRRRSFAPSSATKTNRLPAGLSSAAALKFHWRHHLASATFSVISLPAFTPIVYFFCFFTNGAACFEGIFSLRKKFLCGTIKFIASYRRSVGGESLRCRGAHKRSCRLSLLSSHLSSLHLSIARPSAASVCPPTCRPLSSHIVPPVILHTATLAHTHACQVSAAPCSQCVPVCGLI